MGRTEDFIPDHFPYSPRKHQGELIKDIYCCSRDGGDLILQSKTGSGKTVCTLSALVEYCLETDKKLIYTTRTNSQQNQVIREARMIKNKIPEGMLDEADIFALPLQGRRNMCLLTGHLAEFREALPEEMSLMCAHRKKRTSEFLEQNPDTVDPGEFDKETFQNMLNDKLCPFYLATLSARTESLHQWISTEIPNSQEIVSHCHGNGICPYEFIKSLLNRARFVVMPYIFVFNDAIRHYLLDWLNEDTANLVLVIDEAHNLPDFLRDMYSFTLSKTTIGTARNEAEDFGIELFNNEIRVSDFLDVLERTMEELAEEFIRKDDEFRFGPSEDDDAVIPQDAVRTNLMSSFTITSNALENGIEKMALNGLAIKDRKKNAGRLPRSYLLTVASFLQHWNSLTEDYYIKLIYDRKNPQLEAYCLDSQRGGVICQTFHSSLHMSGTLEPLGEYRDCLGLENAVLRSYPSPFDPANLLMLYHPSLTTKFTHFSGNLEMIEAYRKEISDILAAHRKNTMIFFPSYRAMKLLEPGGTAGALENDRDIFFERSKATQKELLDQVHTFKKTAGGVYCSVMGGRVSEGMDFPGETLELALLVGLPFPKPTARSKGLKRYYDIKTGNGWLFAVISPTIRKTLQCIGRLIRSKDDRGCAVILDFRVKRFEQYLEGMAVCERIPERVKEFFRK